MVRYVLCKFISAHKAVVAAYACGFSVGNYQMRHFKHQVVVEHLLENCVAQLHMRGLAFHNYLWLEVVVKGYNIAPETLASKFYGLFAGHQLQRISPLCIEPVYEVLPYLFLRGKGDMFFSQRVKNSSFHSIP